MALKGAMSDYGAENGLLVSWGGFKTTTLNEARTSFLRIRLWNQADLLDALFDAYDGLDEDLRAEVPLKRIWIRAKEPNTEL